jgi:hypothetical protein
LRLRFRDGLLKVRHLRVILRNPDSALVRNEQSQQRVEQAERRSLAFAATSAEEDALRHERLRAPAEFVAEMVQREETGIAIRLDLLQEDRGFRETGLRNTGRFALAEEALRA